MTTPFRLIAATLAIALGLTPWLTGHGATPSRNAAVTHTVTIDGTRFDPEVLTVSAGDIVIWVNKDPFPHTATSESGKFDSKSIDAGKSWKYKTVKRGDFAYICTLHPTMKGTLRVK